MDAKIELMHENLFEFCQAEREKYGELYQVLLKYVKEHDLFISDSYELTGLSNTYKFFDFHYQIYCSKPLLHTNRIINLMYWKLAKHPMIGTLVMNTSVKNEEFSISFDNRFICKLFAMQRDRPKGNSVDLMKLVKPAVINKIKYLPAEIEIIDIYQKLYNGLGSFSAMKHFVSTMYKQIMDDRTINEEDTGHTSNDKANDDKQTGNDKANDDKQTSNDDQSDDEDLKSKTCYERKKEELEAIKMFILTDFLKGRQDVTLLGPIAVDWYTMGEKLCPKYDKIQICGTIKPAQLKEELQTFLNSLGRKYNVSLGDSLDLLIPKDFRTKRIIYSMSIRTDAGIKEKPFLEYFNCCDFELIPVFDHNSMLIANKYVLLRFLFIDLWIYKFIYSIGRLEKKTYLQKRDRLVAAIKQAEAMDFIAEGTLGFHYDYDISKRQKKIGQEEYFAPYSPSMHVQKNGAVRKL